MPKLEATVGGVIPGFRFRIDAMGFSIGQASTITGIKVDTDVVTYRGGADSNTFRKQRGLTNYEDLVVERLHTNNSDIWNMLGLVFSVTAGMIGINSPIYKTDLTIVLYNLQGEEVVKYFVRSAWVKGYEITDIDANSSNYAVERVIFAHEGISQLGIDPRDIF